VTVAVSKPVTAHRPGGLHCCLRGRSWPSLPPTARSAPTAGPPRCAASPTRPSRGSSSVTWLLRGGSSVAGTMRASGRWWRPRSRTPGQGSAPSGCCQRPGRLGMPVRTATCAGWLRRRRPSTGSVRRSAGLVGRRSGRRVSIWSSTGVCRTGCTCSAPCWPGAGCGSSGSPATNAPTPRCGYSPSASRPWAGSPKSSSPTGWAASKAGSSPTW